MQIIYQIGTVLFWPFANYLIGEIITLVCIIVMCVSAKKQNKLGKILLWWLLPIPFVVLFARSISQGHGLFPTGIYDGFLYLSIALLWFSIFQFLWQFIYGLKILETKT